MTTIEEANAMSREEFVERFGGLYEHSSWIAEGAGRERPFGNLEDMRRAFERAVEGASEERKLGLIRTHPDLAGKAAVAGELTEESASEQTSAGLDRLSPEEFERFTRMNEEYRRKFEIPMVVCVREHTKESILENAEARLANSPEEEIRTALGEIHKIAGLRLGDMIEGGK
ncbi:MAG: 2-oxo-4-hydroxy-4-carboxy-5-ureidoimidazoline decarboxylase [Rubrobacter sp.]|jgi:OHCU decarboxylase|nr:2-oxo-4-hydroxy-4-carboxy-5-ureidoimidazoline decarboxylase [Rubrobacter sp.]